MYFWKGGWSLRKMILLWVLSSKVHSTVESSSKSTSQFSVDFEGVLTCFVIGTSSSFTICNWVSKGRQSSLLKWNSDFSRLDTDLTWQAKGMVRSTFHSKRSLWTTQRNSRVLSCRFCVLDSHSYLFQDRMANFRGKFHHLINLAHWKTFPLLVRGESVKCNSLTLCKNLQHCQMLTRLHAKTTWSPAQHAFVKLAGWWQCIHCFVFIRPLG